MKPLNSLPSFFEEMTKIIGLCPLCQTKTNAMEANILEEAGESHLLHLRCRHCQAAVLALVTVTPAGLSSVGMITDLTVLDAQKFKEAEALSADEMIDLNLLLKDKVSFFQTLEASIWQILINILRLFLCFKCKN